MCDKKTAKKVQVCQERIAEKFYADVSMITKKSFLRYMKTYPRQEYFPPWPPPNSNIYPKANIYYAFNEDTNPFTRLDAAYQCSDFDGPHFEPPKEPFTLRDPYHDEEARKKYIVTKPTAFAIFGKPGLNSAKLASMIADAWGCVLISPEVLIKEEIEKKTDKGRYIAEILENGGCLEPEIVLNLIESRVRMRDVMHRGYIVEGLPFIPNETLDYSSYPAQYASYPFIDTCSNSKMEYEQEAVLGTSSKYSVAGTRDVANNKVVAKSLMFIDSTSTLSSAEYQVPPTSTCRIAMDIEEEIPREIDNIFTAWPIKPTVIIYIMCPDQDAIRKREQLRLDAHTGRVVDTALLDMHDSVQPNFSQDHNKDNDEFPMEFYQEIMKEETILEDEQKRHLLLRIPDMKINVNAQCQIYEKLAMPIIEKWVLAHNPQNVLRVDGRALASKMFQIVNVQLRILPIPRLFLPKLMIDHVQFNMQGEAAVVSTVEDEFDDMENEQAFAEFTNRGVISVRFPWRLSAWNFFCPVELAKGRTVEGVPKYAVRFMSKLFFLSSQKAADLFVENPRPFLCPPNPRPACRIVIFGPRYSGKSEISRRLAQQYGGYEVDVYDAEKAFVEDKINTKITNAMRRMVHSVMRELRKSLRIERDRKEASRLVELQAWFDEASSLISQLFNIQNEPKTDEQQQRLKEIREMLDEHDLKKLATDRKLQQRVKKDIQLLYNYMPENLKTEEPPVRKITEHDPEVVSILEANVSYLRYEKVDLTAEEKVELIINKIKMLPDEPIDTDIYRDNGFIVNGMYVDPDVWEKFIESDIIVEDIIVLWEDEPFNYLIDKWHRMRKYEESCQENYTKPISNVQDEFDGEGGYMSAEMIELEQYIAELREFNFKWQNMRETIETSGQNVIICDLKSVDNIQDLIEAKINERYTLKANVMSDDEKANERMIEDMIALENASVNEDMEGEGTDFDEDEEKQKMDVRRLGDTSHYCPVALGAHQVLWNGKEEFSATYADKIYTLSSEKALEEFVENPRSFSVPFDKPPLLVPPLRISIVGSTGSGKTTLADSVSKEYGLTHTNYFKRMVRFMKERALLPPASKHNLVLLESYDDIVDLPEDLTDEKYNTDRSTVRTFIENYVKNGGILPDVLRRTSLFNFFRPPYDQHGLILDGFPSCQEDVQLMLENYTVPEIVIELTCSRDTTFQRKMPVLLKAWTEALQEKKHIEEARYFDELHDYETKREAWIKTKLSERRRKRFLELGMDREVDDEYEYDPDLHILDISTVKSTDTFYRSQDSDIFDPDPEQAIFDKIELKEAWKIEHPEPEVFTDWEELEAAQERIAQQLEAKCDTDAVKLTSTRTAMENELIPWIEIDGERNQQAVLVEVLRILDPYVFRNTSMFERCYRVDLGTAERLLDCGYYFVSSFGRRCPVQLYEHKNPLLMFLPMEANDEIYPLIHRQYIYFLGGTEARTAFVKNPIKYLEQDSCVPLIPLKIAIIGPPKCGKTTLAERFVRTYGMKVITRGKALRHMLTNFSWTELARLTEAHLRSGHAALNESIARAVEMYSIDPRSVSQGYILDGFPTNRPESEELAFLGIQPMIVIDLKANFDFCLECLANDDDEESFKKPANLSTSFLAHRYAEWIKEQEQYRDWLTRFSQNIVELDATKSKWHVWTRADNAVRSKYTEILRYFREADYDAVHKLANMCVSPYEFRLRQSIYESFCPACLLLEDIMNFSGAPANRENVLQFHESFYWICPQHLDSFIKNPLQYLPPLNAATLPTERPEILEEIVDPEHACWAMRLRAGGFCLVHYVDNLPSRTMTPGKPNLGAIYQDKVYLFCSEECRKKFLSHYKKYANVDINFRRTLPPIDIWTLPDLGFLEQTVASLIVRAVKHVGIKRPKIPGLSASATAAIYIGVFLKVHNDSCALKEVDVYERANLCLEARANIINVATHRMKKKINPYVSLPKLIRPSSKAEDQRISIISQISSRTINFIKFRRTSPTQTMIDPTRRVPVPDTRFDYLCDYFKPASKVPAFLNVVDIAGLVKGAAEGQGLGNAFLSHISACDGIFHLCRAFEDDDVTHIEGDVNPARDLEIISEELRLKDVEFLHAHLEKLEKLVVRGNDKKLKPEYDTLLKVKGVLMEEKRHIRFADWSANDIEVLNKYLFLTSKPVIYLINLSEKDYIRKKNKWLVKIKEWVDKNDPGAILIPFSGAFENKIFDMDEAERAKYYEEQKVTSALDKIIVQGYKALQLQYFFTAGHDEVKAWTIQKGTKAPQAAGRIHTDFEKGFIMGEVMKFDDFKNEGSEAAVKAAGKYRQQGRNYVVEDGDIIFFKFNAGAGLKDPKKK